jgi:putative FmdB family regulatory protein
MPRYDYRCRACGDTFEVNRSMTATTAVACPHGHDDTVKLLSTIALTGRGSGSGSGPVSMPRGAGGGCCGGGCGCG